MQNLEVNICNPFGILFQEKISLLLLPCIDGEIGVLHNHIPMIFSLKFGLIKMLDASNKVSNSFYVDSGVAKISNTDVNILCNQCCESTNIDEAYVKEKIDLLAKLGNKTSKLDFYKKILEAITKHD